MAKCANCGFLASMNTESRNLDETEQHTREQGASPNHLTPICFMSVYDIWKELHIVLGSPGFHDLPRIVDFLQKGRDCDKFTAWQHGFTPKEHREMIDRQSMLKWQAEREEFNRKWQAHQETKNLVINAIIAGIFTIIGAVITYLVTK